MVGRGKLKVELISNEKSRKLAFKNRKEGLIKKLHELTTLCDVSACMVISETTTNQEPDIWPQNPEEVRQIIEFYKVKKSHSSCKQMRGFGLPNFFFHDREKKMEEELKKLRRRAKFPIHREFLNDLTEAHLKEFRVLLENKAQILKSRIDFLTIKQEFSMNFIAPRRLGLDDPPPPLGIDQDCARYSTKMMDFLEPRQLGIDDPPPPLGIDQDCARYSTKMMDFVAPRRLGLDDPPPPLGIEQDCARYSTKMMDFLEPRQLGLDDPPPPLGIDQDCARYSTKMMDFVEPRRLGLDPPQNFYEQENDYSLVVPEFLFQADETDTSSMMVFAPASFFQAQTHSPCES